MLAQNQLSASKINNIAINTNKLLIGSNFRMNKHQLRQNPTNVQITSPVA